MKKKHSNYILVIDSDAFGQRRYQDVVIHASNKDSVFNEEQVNNYLSVRQRRRVEHMEQYRQILPYVILFRTLENGETQFFPYRREETVGENRLAGNVSIGYGGHIDAPDVLFDDDGAIAFRETMVAAATRELKEEVVFENEIGTTTLELVEVVVAGTILCYEEAKKNSEVPVGNVHAGYVIFQPIPEGSNVRSGEDELTSLPPMTGAEILASGMPLEPWTRIVLERFEQFHDWNNKVVTEEFGEVSVDANTLDG